MSIFATLRDVQYELKAPKSQKGRFGQHRSAEAILEQAKPVLHKYKLALTLSEKIVEINGRNYVESTATVYNDEGESHGVSGFAWEGEISRGLDASQVTGMATSYARKYAMGGLFAIDDTKDADTHEKAAESKPKVAPKPVEAAPVDELAKAKKELQEMLMAYGHNNQVKMKIVIKRVLEKNTVDTVEEANEVMQALTDGAV